MLLSEKKLYDKQRYERNAVKFRAEKLDYYYRNRDQRQQYRRDVYQAKKLGVTTGDVRKARQYNDTDLVKRILLNHYRKKIADAFVADDMKEFETCRVRLCEIIGKSPRE